MQPVSPKSPLSAELVQLLDDAGVTVADLIGGESGSGQSPAATGVAPSNYLENIHSDVSSDKTLSDFQSVSPVSTVPSTDRPGPSFNPGDLLTPLGSQSSKSPEPLPPLNVRKRPFQEPEEDILSKAMRMTSETPIVSLPTPVQSEPQRTVLIPAMPLEKMSWNDQQKLLHMLGPKEFENVSKKLPDPRPRKAKSVKEKAPARKVSAKSYTPLENQLLTLGALTGASIDLKALKPDIPKFTLENVKSILDRNQRWISAGLDSKLGDDLDEFILDISEWKGFANTLDEWIKCKMKEREIPQSLLTPIRNLRANVLSQLTSDHNKDFEIQYTQALQYEIAKIQAQLQSQLGESSSSSK